MALAILLLMTTILISPEAKCQSLSPTESDAMFFPGTGGKVNKARDFCNGCPIGRACLIEAIEYGLAGFISGTTEKERKVMAKNYHVTYASKTLVINVPPKVELLDVEEKEDEVPDPVPVFKVKFKRRRKRRVVAVAI